MPDADIAFVCLIAFAGSALTLYSGFGLGTVLLPAMALVFPPLTAVAATGAVHLLNNAFKAAIVRGADWRIVLRFGAPAIFGALAGSALLASLGETRASAVLVGALMIAFAILELLPWFQRLAVPERFMPLGGALSGFFGGLAGQQGALRSAFLIKSGLDPQRFIATGVMIAILVDVSRMPAYILALRNADDLTSPHGVTLLAAATLSAFAGAWLGARYVKKITIGAVRLAVAAMMIAMGAALIGGLIG